MTQNLVKNIIGNVTSSYQVNLRYKFLYNQKLHKFSHFHLSTLGICNAYLNKRHVVGKFFEWPEFFLLGGLGANGNMSGKLGMKLAIKWTHASSQKPCLEGSQPGNVPCSATKTKLVSILKFGM